MWLHFPVLKHVSLDRDRVTQCLTFLLETLFFARAVPNLPSRNANSTSGHKSRHPQRKLVVVGLIWGTKALEP